MHEQATGHEGNRCKAFTCDTLDDFHIAPDNSKRASHGGALENPHRYGILSLCKCLAAAPFMPCFDTEERCFLRSNNNHV